MRSIRQSCKCGQEVLCESISKIIHFAVVTNLRLPASIMDVSCEDDGRPWRVLWPLLFNLSSTPRRPLSCQLSFLHILLHVSPSIHQDHLAQAQQQNTLGTKKCPLLLISERALLTLQGSVFAEFLINNVKSVAEIEHLCKSS